ncbi:MAG: hypothetical protein AAF160_10165 [Pseudomonadota bacterium]
MTPAETDGPLCILHIGAEKTGTTSIQESLYANRERLAAARIAWPEFLGHRNHKLLAAAALPADSVDAAMEGNAFAGDAAAHGAYRAEIAARLGQLAAAHHTVLISSEDLQRLPREAIETLGALLRPSFARFRVIAFLLRQDVLALRRRAQLIRTGHTAPPGFPDLGDAEERRFYDYAAVLGDWAAAFGEDAVLPAPFGEGSAAAGQDSVAHFYRLAGIDDAEFAPVPRLNSSPDTPNLEILNDANGIGLLPGDPRRDALEAGLAQFETDRTPPVDRTAAAGFVERFAMSNAALADRWLGGQAPFNADFSAYPVEDPGPQIAQEARRRLLHLAVSGASKVSQQAPVRGAA